MAMFRAVVAGHVVVAASLLVAGCGGMSASRSAELPKDVKALARQSLSQIDGDLKVAGLQKPVDVIRDEWGVPHIYAQNADDLFFAQGYVMAQDRLWQMEWWRREHEGRLAEVLGPAAVERDRQARLLKYRGPFDDSEWTSYHKDAKRIFTAYASGINAYIAQHGDNLPVEFTLTGIKPEPWTAETVVLREPAFGDAVSELRLAMDVAKVGVKEANRRAAPDPWDDLTVPDGLDVTLITDEVVAAARAGGGRGQSLPRPAILEQYRKLLPNSSALLLPVSDIQDLGSNNWVIGGAMSPTGKPLVSNDPHREVSNPSLRYIVHLNAPGWNVVGSGDPPFVGVSMGHNDRVAWGLTITGTDFQDVFVEDLNPANLNEMIYNGKPEPLKVVTETINVKGESPRTVELKFSRHGPIFFVDQAHHKAYALRSIFTEPGTASYLGELKLDQAQNCKEFIELAMYWKANSENLICGDVDGNIGFQASALTPNRKGWLGRLPVPGTGKYEWDGFRAELPKEYNPSRGFIATANHNINPKGYWPPVMFKTTNTLPYDRITRILQVIKPGQMFSMEDSQKLQRDVYSLRGAADQAAFRGWTAKDPDVERARDMVAKWDALLSVDSVPAAIYITWRRLPEQSARAGEASASPRHEAIEAGLRKTIDKLTADLGADWSQWRYGRVHTQAYPHPLLKEFDLPTVERRGGNGAVGADGATYREIIDVSNWDRSLTINTPGQSGQPESPFYGNLLPLWANDQYFQMTFSRPAVDAHAAHRLKLTP
ncbi:MAG: penicillin acylase family protein [Acidobacteriia bacterium]|nr:penicillin acylase family protein [Terriglobia bacterium]